MWALALKFVMTAGATLAGSALARVFTRFGIYFTIMYGSELLMGNNPASGLIDMVLHPNNYITAIGNAAFGREGEVGWPQFILYETNFWPPFSSFVTAGLAWFITKQWMQLGK